MHEKLSAAGWGPIAGHKIGCTTTVMQEYLKIDAPCAGGVFGERVRLGIGHYDRAGMCRPGVECEIAVRLSADLPGREGGYDHAAIGRAVGDATGYDLSRTVAQIRPGYGFDVTCQGSVPEALICALEAESYEDAVRLAVSLGGDADTQACIAGAIAEARFSVPASIAETALAYLDGDLRSVAIRFRDNYGMRTGG